MNQIYKFNEFVSIFESEQTIDKQLLVALKKVTNQRMLGQWVGCPEFGGVYTKPFNSDGDEVFYKWGSIEKSFEGVIYEDGRFFAKEDPNMNVTQLWSNYDRYLWSFRHRIWDPIEDMIKRSGEASNFNPFENGVENMPIIKDFESKGMEIVSTDREKKNGTLVLRFPNAKYDYLIQTSGYIRRKGFTGFITSKEELIKKIYKLEDLIPKIKFVYYTYLKDVAESEGIPKKSIEKIIYLLSNEEGTNNPIYKEEYDKIVQEYPIMALYLPEPVGGGDKELIKGAKILGRLGLF